MASPPDRSPCLRRCPRFVFLAGLLALPFALLSCGPDDSRPTALAPVRYDAAGLAPGVRPPPGPHPNLVLVLIDTLRADAFRPQPGTGVRTRMPRLEERARSGVVATQVVSPCSWTLPSVASLVTGLLPTEHDVSDTDYQTRLADSFTTFPEILSSTYGYETAVFTGAPWHGGSTVFQQGFQVSRKGYGLQGTREMVGAWARARDRTRPFFLYLHSFEVHDPYGASNHPWPQDAPPSAPPRPLGPVDAKEPWSLARACLLDGAFRARMPQEFGMQAYAEVQRCLTRGCLDTPRPEIVRELHEAYLDGVGWMDGLLDESLGILAELGLLEGTLLVVTSDHGEAFGEGGIVGHGRRLEEALVRVPFVAWGPPPFDRPQTVEAPLALIDLFPSFFDLAGFAPPRDIAGRSILPTLRGQPLPRSATLSHVRSTPSVTGGAENAVRMSARTADWKYVLTYGMENHRARESLFDLRADPQEQRDLMRGRSELPPEALADPVLRQGIETVRDRVCREGLGHAPSTESGPSPCHPAR